MRNFLLRLKRASGPRGAFLLSWAFVDILYGIGLFTASWETRQTPVYAFPDALLYLPVWGVFWLGVAGVLISAAFSVRDAYGFTAAISVKVLWGLLMLGGQLTGDIPRGYVSTGIWLGAACAIYVCARHLPVIDGREDE